MGPSFGSLNNLLGFWAGWNCSPPVIANIQRPRPSGLKGGQQTYNLRRGVRTVTQEAQKHGRSSSEEGGEIRMLGKGYRSFEVPGSGGPGLQHLNPGCAVRFCTYAI